MFTGPICSSRCFKPRQVSSSASKFLAGQPRDLRIGAQHLRLYVHLGQAACFEILKIGVQLGQFGRKRGAVLAQLVQIRALSLQLRLHLGQLQAESLRLLGDGLRRGQRSCARFDQFLLPFHQLGVFPDTLLALGRGRGALLFDRLYSPAQVAEDPVDTLEGRIRAAPPFFQAGQLRRHLRGFLLQRLALLPQRFQLRLPRAQGAVRLLVVVLEPRRLFALFRNCLPLHFARVLVARCLRLPLLQAPLDALGFIFHLLERRAQSDRLAFALPALFAARFQLRLQLLDGAAQGVCVLLRLSEIGFQLRQPALRLAQLALQCQRALAGRLAARHRRAVEALAVRRQKIRVPKARRQPLRVDGISRQVAISQLGQDSFERPSSPFSTFTASFSGITPGSFTCTSPDAKSSPCASE